MALKAFADLYAALDSTTKTTVKVEALRHYFLSVPAKDAAWAVYFLIGRKPRQIVGSPKMRAWAAELAEIPTWLFEESYDAVGDLGEAIALLLPAPLGGSQVPLAEWIEQRLLPLRGLPEDEQRSRVVAYWQETDERQRLVLNKLLTGNFRVGVSQGLVIRALAEVSGLDASVIAHRLMGDWEPTESFYNQLVHPDTEREDTSRPYPFFLAHPLEDDPATLGDPADWQAEWKWDGIRSQLIRREGRTFLWSRGEELITERFPEIAAIAERFRDGTVIDGEILPWSGEGVLPFTQLQRRIGRKTLTKRILAEVPVILMAYDLLEWGERDIRSTPLAERREKLAALCPPLPEADSQRWSLDQQRLFLSPIVPIDSWDAIGALRTQSRARNVEGLMLKRKASPYRVGRQRGDWWKWKVSPLTIDAVLIYAQPGHGKRASLFTDYTFGVWDDGKLVPIAKAYSGLTDAEIREVDAFVRRNTIEKFGPVRTVKPELVFELAFEAIQPSTRHKSGIAVRFPRMLRWRHDKPIEEADSLETIQAMLRVEHRAPTNTVSDEAEPHAEARSP